jgi:hypothetical protein
MVGEISASSYAKAPELNVGGDRSGWLFSLLLVVTSDAVIDFWRKLEVLIDIASIRIVRIRADWKFLFPLPLQDALPSRETIVFALDLGTKLAPALPSHQDFASSIRPIHRHQQNDGPPWQTRVLKFVKTTYMTFP